MNVTKEEGLTRPFILTPRDLERICAFFDSTDNIIIKTTGADKLVREFNSPTELISFENAPNKKIESLGINVFSNDYKMKAFIHFSNSFFKNISIKIEGEEQWVTELIGSLEEQFHAAKPWYSLLALSNFKAFVIDLLICWLVTVPSSSFIFNRFVPGRPNWGYAAVLGFTVIFSVAWSRIKRVAFPMGTFAIGQGAKRHSDLEIYRTLIIFGLIVEIVGGVITSIMFN